MNTIAPIPLAEQIRCHYEAMPTQTVWRISSRWPAWSKWKLVGPKPHGEHWPFDAIGLAFPSEAEALQALKALQQANAGDFMLVQSWRETNSSLPQAQPPQLNVSPL